MNVRWYGVHKCVESSSDSDSNSDSNHHDFDSDSNHHDSDSALDISTGPAHFSDRRISSGQYILSFTGPYGPPRYMSGHQISNSAGPNDDKSQHIFFARVPVPHLGSTFATARSQRGASRSRACQYSVSFGWWFIEMRGDFWWVNLKY